jgi:hypothetical protein
LLSPPSTTKTMGRRSRRLLPVFVPTLLLLHASIASADIRQPWSLEQLSAFATLVVRGEVVEVSSQWDPAVQSIYTYATVDVRETWKGAAPSARIVVKMLGGRVGDVELRINGSPTFTAGDRVALWLEVRPRDGTLYPAAFAQGVRLLDRMTPAEIATMRQAASASPLRTRTFTVNPSELRTEAPFNFLPPSEGGPGRWHEADLGVPIAVDYQPPPAGLGGGLPHIDTAIALWNASGMRLVLQRGAARGPRCLQTFEGNGRVSITFNDPCGEISDSGSVLGFGGAYMTSIFQVIGGTRFAKIVQGMVVLNNSPGALTFLSNPNCFQDAIAHNLGHAIGLGHSEQPNAMMWPDPQSSCTATPSSLSADDIAGVRAIYPGGTGGAGSLPGTPTGLIATVTGTTVTLSWAAPATGGAPSTYIVEAGSAPGIANLVVAPTNSTATTITFSGVPPGTYYVRLRAGNALGSSGASNEVIVTVGCATPAPPANLAFSKNGFTVTLTWQAPTIGVAPLGYRLVVGSAPGLENVLILDQGPFTTLTAVGPPGTYFVRVRSLSACGASAPSNELVIVLP